MADTSGCPDCGKLHVGDCLKPSPPDEEYDRLLAKVKSLSKEIEDAKERMLVDALEILDSIMDVQPSAKAVKIIKSKIQQYNEKHGRSKKLD